MIKININLERNNIPQWSSESGGIENHHSLNRAASGQRLSHCNCQFWRHTGSRRSTKGCIRRSLAHLLTPTFTMSSTDWDSKTVIGFKAKTPTTVRKESDLHGTNVNTSLPKSLVVWLPTSHLCIAARRSGASVETDKKISAGNNKAHVGMSTQTCWHLDLLFILDFPRHRPPTDSKTRPWKRSGPSFQDSSFRRKGIPSRPQTNASWHRLTAYDRLSKLDVWTRAWLRKTSHKKLTRSPLSYKTTNPAKPFPIPRSSVN